MRNRLLKAATCFLLLLIGAGTATSIRAVTDEDIYRNFRFNFINPGGRAHGMGGSLISVVDDATAIETNPAMMSYLARQEIFVEFRAIRYDEGIFADRKLPDDAIAQGTQATGEIADVNSISYFAYVRPSSLTAKRRWAFGIGRQELLNTKITVDQPEVGVTLPSYGPGEAFFQTSDGQLELDIIQWNAGFSSQLNRDWTLGITASYATLNIASLTNSVNSDPDGLVFVPGNPKDPIDLQQDIQGFTVAIDDESDTAMTGSLGLHWSPRSRYPDGVAPFSLGLVYNRGASFEVPQTFVPEGGAPETFPFALKVPDRYGFGFGYQSFFGPKRNQLIWTLNLIGIKYSDLLEGFQSNLNGFTRLRLDENEEQLATPEMTIEDAVEFRTGVELRYRMARGWRFAVRGGYARLPANDIYAEDVQGVDPTYREVLLQYFAQGEALNQASTGVSFAYTSSGFGFQLDAGVSYNENWIEGVISTIWRF